MSSNDLTPSEREKLVFSYNDIAEAILEFQKKQPGNFHAANEFTWHLYFLAISKIRQ